MMQRFLATIAAALGVTIAPGMLGAQNQVPIPSFVSTFSVSGATRGLQFQTPIPMTIVGLRVPDETNHGMQNVALYKLAAKAPAFPATAQSNPIFYQTGTASATTITLSQSFQPGDWIGVLGACGDSTTMRNSYGSPGGFMTTIQGNPVTLWRFLTQTNLVTAGGTAPYSSEDAGNVGRIEIYYTSTSIIGSGTAQPGTQMAFTLTAPIDPGKPYQCASSFGTGPIPIGTRLLNLSPDDLFGISVSGVLPQIFGQYTGVLDNAGGGTANLNLPNIPQTIGTKIHTAFVTVDASAPQSISSVSDTFSFTIQ